MHLPALLLALDPNIKSFFDNIWGVILLFIGYGKEFLWTKDATTGAYAFDPVNMMILSGPVLAIAGVALRFFLGLLPKGGSRRRA